MPDIEFSGLTKTYGALTAVDDLSTHVASGRITAFLGANGSGKTTTMRMLLGLSQPNRGAALINGQPYRELDHPLRLVGAVLDQGFHPNRSARNHLRIIAAQADSPAARVDVVLAQFGLSEAAGRRVGGFSLGMRQRLNLAAAMIGEPDLLVLDEPLNGLDPAGIQTMRAFLRGYADAGGTVLLSSHLLSEIAHVAEDAIVIDHGRLVGAGPVTDLAPASNEVLVTSPDAVALAAALTRAGALVQSDRENGDRLVVTGLTAEQIGRVVLEAGAVVTEMRAREDSLEAAYAALTEPKDVTP
jgi:ABC-2 type transport system ATP-binding protein